MMSQDVESQNFDKAVFVLIFISLGVFMLAACWGGIEGYLAAFSIFVGTVIAGCIRGTVRAIRKNGWRRMFDE